MEVRLVCGVSPSTAVSRHLRNTVCQQGRVHPRDRLLYYSRYKNSRAYVCRSCVWIAQSYGATNQKENLLNLLLINELDVVMQIL